MARGANTAYVTYTLREATSMATLTLSPLVCWKEYHAEMHPWTGFPTYSAQDVGGWTVQATPDAPRLRLLVRGATWQTANWWHSTIVYEREAERGQDATEDLFCPAVAQVTLRVGQTVALIATVEKGEPDDDTIALAQVLRHQETVVAGASDAVALAADTDTARDLIIATDPFIVQGMGIRTTVLAGYPWFTDWGRDTMISLPGLCLTTGRLTLAREILMDFSGYVSYGMIPNRFPDNSETPEYNTVDATLWFVHACDRYLEASPGGDPTFLKTLTPIVENIVAAHIAGTRFGIMVDPADSLLSAGQYGVQLTWMDAKVGDWVVTPRMGKAVEICALWIGVLRILAKWKGAAGGQTFTEQADTAQAAFREKFVRPDGLGLYDLLRPDGTPDAAVRPNQVIAAALPYTPVADETLPAILAIAGEDLLTPYGLRSLSRPRIRRIMASTVDRSAPATARTIREPSGHGSSVRMWMSTAKSTGPTPTFLDLSLGSSGICATTASAASPRSSTATRPLRQTAAPGRHGASRNCCGCMWGVPNPPTAPCS